MLSVRGDSEDPFSRGYICPKAYALKDLYEDDDRIRQPLIKRDGQWQEASWEEALTAAAEGLASVQSRHGRDAVATFVGNPTVHSLPATLALPAFIRTLGSRVRFSASSVDQFPRMLAAYLVYGGQFSFPIADIDRTDYFLVLGANPVVSNGSLMTAPGFKKRLAAIRNRGGRLVVVDPRRTETAEVADEHLFIRPGADAPFLLALLNVIFADGLVRLGKAEGLVEGLDRLAGFAEAFSPERVEKATGIDADRIRRIAREFAAAPSSACYGRVGTCLQSYGTLANYLVDAINLVCGRVDAEGGVMFTTPATPAVGQGHYGRWRSRVRGIPEFGGEIPAAVMAEEMETEGDGQLRGLFTMAGNPVLSTPNGRRLEGALAGLEFMVSVDPALNETTCHADVILPPRHSFENSQYSLVFNAISVRNTAKFCPPVFEAGPDSLSEWEILGRLCEKLCEVRATGNDGGVDNPAAMHFALQPNQIVDNLLAAGPHGLSVDSLLEHPSGVDLGALEGGRLGDVLAQGSGFIRLDADVIGDEVERLGGEMESMSATNGLVLIGRRQLRSNNSWMHNCPSLMKGRDRCTLLMHPDDALEAGVQTGGEAVVETRTGRQVVVVEVSDQMMAGVVSLPHGFGHNRKGSRMAVAAARPGVSINDLSDEEPLEGLMGNAILNGVPVNVQNLS